FTSKGSSSINLLFLSLITSLLFRTICAISKFLSQDVNTLETSESRRNIFFIILTYLYGNNYNGFNDFLKHTDMLIFKKVNKRIFGNYLKNNTISEINWQTAIEFEDITYKKCNGVARIAFNRPEVRNAFRPKTTSELLRAFHDA